MRSNPFRSIAIISGAILLLLAGGCGSGKLIQPYDAFTEPVVVEIFPPNGSINFAVDGNVIASFNKAMNPSTIDTDTFIITGPGPAASTTKAADNVVIPGTITYNSADFTAVYTPSPSPFWPNTTYCATLTTDIEDIYGNSIKDRMWCFKTGDASPAPAVGSTSPADGATGVAIDADITATFTIDMDPATITAATFIVKDAGGTAVPGTVIYDVATRTATFTPSSSLASLTNYTATVTTGAKSTGGKALLADHAWSFTTTQTVVNQIDYFVVNDNASFTRSLTPMNVPVVGGSVVQTIEADGTIKLTVTTAPGYVDDGFYIIFGRLGNLNGYAVEGTPASTPFSSNLWFDSDNDGEFFVWVNDVLTGLGGDCYIQGDKSIDGALNVDDNTLFQWLVPGGGSYTLLQLKNGAAPCVNSNTNTAIWIGIAPNGGSLETTILSFSAF